MYVSPYIRSFPLVPCYQFKGDDLGRRLNFVVSVFSTDVQVVNLVYLLCLGRLDGADSGCHLVSAYLAYSIVGGKFYLKVIGADNCPSSIKARSA